ncbi:copine-8-like isoform X2 [Daktulosphaira vitifoliae]|uniref:copine-8-like isoform X2 n=1 Tax=Daktulosphaira vitifoliae TaxID=58002 RepID=UPI0021AAE5FA|nr:copine-8-like isoform X2 [Daktulosphaira vitifoliae]
MAAFIPGSSTEPTSEIELTLSCRNLLDCDVFSKSDPICVVFMKTPETSRWVEICRTECINNSLNPDFVTKAHVLYRFEVQQNIKFEVYDVDSRLNDLKSQDFLGSCETTLGHIVSSVNVTLPLKGVRPNNKGQVIVKAEELLACHDEVTLQFSGRDLSRNDWVFKIFSWCVKAYPFLEFHKVGEDGKYQLVHRTEVANWTTNPSWKPIVLPVRSLCGTDYDRDIKVCCYHYKHNGDHILIGEFHSTMNQFQKGPGSENDYKIVVPKSNKNHGTIRLNRFEVNKIYTFLDYVMNGTQINCTFAIDFTASNGDPKDYNSLHYLSNRPNQYEQALAAVGEIIQDYDSDKMFPALGFGARIPPHGNVSHEFFLNLHASDPYCAGIEGVINAYHHCIRSVQLYGPTNFSPVINHVAKFAQTYQDGSQYFVLLIITDGVITDMHQTKQAIIKASTLPLSIIIVGVGNADFQSMEELDGDTVTLEINGVRAARDIVQFVPFKDFQQITNPLNAKSHLAREVLAEIPAQIVSYMKSRNITPNIH